MNEQQEEGIGSLSVFISYAHEDEELLIELQKHLGPLRRSGLITTWYDRQIVPGTEWSQEVDRHLNAAALILLLISSDFLDSDYCYSNEMQHALGRHKKGDAVVIPILLRPVAWDDRAPFANLACLPHGGKTVTEWPNRDAAFRDIAQGIRQAIEQLRPAQLHSPGPSAPAGQQATSPVSSSPNQEQERSHPIQTGLGWLKRRRVPIWIILITVLVAALVAEFDPPLRNSIFNAVRTFFINGILVGSGSLEQDDSLGIVAMEEEEQARLMHNHRLGKGQCHAHKTG